ncbi:MAG TPA: lysozyme inhibitor LprI family protein [Dyella sp.]|uniref:lysozyme inhibitor LprI family protein n=1 Tax=Dyella sp. TaxID=1869338 RepID=UPI002D79B7C9|nr:lysozyme inhibitor LprI family protein [Dyella sp.]HET6552545.1 lysozyme inhibitor LprI family protein [Dyella sp.]
MNNPLSRPALALRRIAPAMAVLIVPALHAQSASFECSHAGTPTEHAICASPALGKKDIEVAIYYRLLLRLKPATAGMAYREFDDQLRDQQRKWITDSRDACKSDLQCLGQAYDKRIDSLLRTFDQNAALTFGRAAD